MTEEQLLDIDATAASTAGKVNPDVAAEETKSAENIKFDNIGTANNMQDPPQT